jgi:pyruvate/2-oxoglutarate/acetoin dehydrogenase E1 component
MKPDLWQLYRQMLKSRIFEEKVIEFGDKRIRSTPISESAFVGDAGQHEQSLWGWIAHIPGICVVVPSNPADAGGLMLSSLEHEDPVIFFEHKLLSELWLGYMGTGGTR